MLAIVLLTAAAAAVYALGLGHAPLAASEAYSALAAAQPSAVKVAQCAVSLDPGKPVLYHLLLHGFCRWAGLGEAGLRSLSVIFGAFSVYLLFALGEELFGFKVGLAAAILWAFNPLAAVLARWARMYSMLIAFALGHMLAMARLRREPGPAISLAAGVLGGAMLYVHFGAMLIVAADVVIILRELRRNGASRSWPAVAIAGLLFLPFTPIMIAQSRELFFGHWLDWLGARQGSAVQMLAWGSGSAAVLLWLLLACRTASEERERLQHCLIYILLPIVALASGTILLRPMFEVRYVSPSFAVMAVVAAYLLDCGGARLRDLGTFALGGLSLALLPLCYSAPRDPWPAIAARIAAAENPREPIFFETGFFSLEGAARTDGAKGFPQGFFRVPFDYYFHRSNPRAAIPGGRPAAARRLIESQVRDKGGAWLVSANKWPDALAELPRGPNVQVDYAARFRRISVFHVRLVSAPLKASTRRH